MILLLLKLVIMFLLPSSLESAEFDSGLDNNLFLTSPLLPSLELASEPLAINPSIIIDIMKEEETTSEEQPIATTTKRSIKEQNRLSAALSRARHKAFLTTMANYIAPSAPERYLEFLKTCIAENSTIKTKLQISCRIEDKKVRRKVKNGIYAQIGRYKVKIISDFICNFFNELPQDTQKMLKDEMEIKKTFYISNYLARHKKT